MTDKIKIIFLDIDGVFNHHQWWDEREHRQEALDGDERYDFDPKCVEIFNYIIAETNAKIVVSSSWRRKNLQYLIDLFNMVGIKGDIIGETPKLRWLCEVPSAYIPRGTEIKNYLSVKHNYPCYEWNLNKCTTDVETYVIIDDDSDMLLEQKDNFVQTSMKVGLTKQHADEVINILNK